MDEPKRGRADPAPSPCDHVPVQSAREAVERLLRGSRLRHVNSVAARCEALYPDDPVLIDACWLHDVGYAVETSTTGMHALDGAAWCRANGLPERVTCLVAWHTGAWFEADERGLLEDWGPTIARRRASSTRSRYVT